MVGVPWGTRCSNMRFVFLIQPNSMNLTDKVSVNVNVSAKCVLVKMYGNSPRKFVRIIRSREAKMNEFPLLMLLFLDCFYFLLYFIRILMLLRYGIRHSCWD
jgi:hypothetical protein